MNSDKQLFRWLLCLHVPPLLALLVYAAVVLRPAPLPSPNFNLPAPAPAPTNHSLLQPQSALKLLP